MYGDICLIGIGTLGGFLAKNISELESTKNLTLIDYDIVEQKNIRNSVYQQKDVGELKTKAIYKKINSNVQLHVQNEKFIEGITKIPKCDLVIDCRDFTYDRENIIDARLYISYRDLIIDCRKSVSYEKQHEGKYISRLSKTDLNYAALNATILIGNGIFNEIVNKQIVHEIPIDSFTEKTKNLISKKDNVDIIYDFNSFDEKLINLQNNYLSIIDINKKNDLTICVGDKNTPYMTKQVPKNNFNSINDIISNFSSLMNVVPFSFNYYIIAINNYNGKFYVELLPETGSA